MALNNLNLKKSQKFNFKMNSLKIRLQSTKICHKNMFKTHQKHGVGLKKYLSSLPQLNFSLFSASHTVTSE